jgi:hypothetical protein
MKRPGSDWFSGEAHEVEAFARQIQAEADGEDWLLAALLSDGLDEDGLAQDAG